MNRISNFKCVLAACAALFAGASAVRAGQIDIGGGWRATWDVSLDPFVTIQSLGVQGDAVFVKKIASFTLPPSNGVFASILIQFTQINANAVSNVVIAEESVTNLTGVPWTDFHVFALDGGDVRFDPAATLASGGPGPIGWDVAPFTQAQFVNSNMQLNIEGGIVPSGGVWTPGAGESGGDLWINATLRPQAPFTTFTLKEIPTPEPTTLALTSLALLFAGRRRAGR